MRLLLDECVDERLCHFFTGHDRHTARYANQAGQQLDPAKASSV